MVKEIALSLFQFKVSAEILVVCVDASDLRRIKSHQNLLHM